MDNIIQKLRALLLAQFTTTFKKYYYGENPIPAQAYFPFLEIVPVTTEIVQRGTGGCRDNLFTIEIRIKDTLKNYLKNNTDVQINDYMQTQVKRMEERENNTFKASTILGVLNSNLRLDNNCNIIDNFNISYNILPLDDSYIVIATVSFQVKLLTY